jgi:hypothetical protein
MVPGNLWIPEETDHCWQEDDPPCRSGNVTGRLEEKEEKLSVSTNSGFLGEIIHTHKVFAQLHQRLREMGSLHPRHIGGGRHNVRTPEFEEKV